MSPHYGSAAREDAVRYHEALTDGVCLAIDHLHAMGMDATAEALLKRMFVKVEGGAVVAETQLQGGYSTAPKAPPEEHILP